MNFAKDAKHAKRQVIYLKGIKCFYIMCMFVRFFMYKVLILWDLLSMRIPTTRSKKFTTEKLKYCMAIERIELEGITH